MEDVGAAGRGARAAPRGAPAAGGRAGTCRCRRGRARRHQSKRYLEEHRERRCAYELCDNTFVPERTTRRFCSDGLAASEPSVTLRGRTGSRSIWPLTVTKCPATPHQQTPVVTLTCSEGCKMRLCVITARNLTSTIQNAHGPRAGAVIAVLEGLCAERSPDARW